MPTMLLLKRIKPYKCSVQDYRYFSRGDVKYMDLNGAEVGTYRPADYAIDLTYSRQIGDAEGIGLSFQCSIIVSGIIACLR